MMKIQKKLENEKIRLNKFLSLAGLGSRRNVENLIKNGEIYVNEKIAKYPYIYIDTQKDIISYQNKKLFLPPLKYIIFNKPPNTISSMKYEKKQKTKILYDFIKEYPIRVFPIGRLDKDTIGLMIFTNDGELANRLMNPKWKVEKEYIAFVSRQLSSDEMIKFRNGIYIKSDKYKTLPSKISLIKLKDNGVMYSIIITEGKKRQIKKMFKHFGIKVIKLIRTRIGPIHIRNLKEGNYRELTSTEIKHLKNIVKLTG